MLLLGHRAIGARVLQGVEAAILRPLRAGSVLANVDRGEISRAVCEFNGIKIIIVLLKGSIE